MKNEKKLVAVYGSLRQGMHNHYTLGKSEYIGTFNSEPVFTMFNVNDRYPAVINEGSTSIIMEVFEADEDIQKKLDQLEGYSEDFDKEDNYYNKETIETPYGEAFIYLFNYDSSNLEKIECGDWCSWMKMQETKNNVKIYNEWEY